MNECSVIIAAYNEAANLKKCLESLIEIDFPTEKLEIIVIDNNSTDNTPDIAHEFTQVIYLKEERQGASFARNKGISRATGEILVFLDADTVVTNNWLSNLISSFADPSVGAVGGAIFPYKKNNLIGKYLGVSLFMNYPRYGKKRKIKGFPSCNLAIRKETIENGFDTNTFGTYGEDKDLCYQIIKNNYKVIFDPSAVIYHHHPETFDQLINLYIKSSSGRVSFSTKHPYSADIIAFNFHIPLIYSLVLLAVLVTYGFTAFVILAAPSLIYLFYNSILSFKMSRNILLSFFVKPFFDIVSVYVIYGAYQYCKLNKKK